jgi:hypothetical protein
MITRSKQVPGVHLSYLQTAMCHKNLSIPGQPRHPVWVVALILASLSLMAPRALAWTFTTCDQQGGYQEGQYWWITQDVWDPASGWQQCLYLDSHSYWQVVANLHGASWVGSYPHASYGVGGNQSEYGGPPLNNVLNSSTPLMAAWNASYPRTNKFDFAYDLWLNGWTYEIMIWLDWNATSPIGGTPFTNATIAGINYNIYEGAGGSGPYCLSFLAQNGMMPAATNFNLCSILGWINNLQWNGGPFWQNPTFDKVQLGWEIVDTEGVLDTYTMNYFDVYLGNSNTTPPTPTVEKSLWDANFNNSFPSGGEYGFSDRDGSPAASGYWSINPTGGLDGNACLEYTVNLQSWSNNPPINYSGFGVGAVENPLPYTLTCSNQSSYRIYLWAKVGGTLASVTNVAGTVDLSFFIPSGTEVYDLTSPLTLSTNWQAYAFDGATNLAVATWLAGAQQLFNQNVTNVNQIELQISVAGSPNVGTLFGYDTNNTVTIGNLKVVELVPGLAPLTIMQTNQQMEIIWADPVTGGTSQLQSATNVGGPFLPVAGAASGAASPYTMPTKPNQQFFRLAWVP